MDDLVRQLEGWLNLERQLKDADPEIRAAAERCRTCADDWNRIRERLRSDSKRDTHAAIPVGMAWIALESLNAYHLSLQGLLMLIVLRKR